MTKRRTVTFLTLLIILLGISACGNRTEDPDGGTGDGADTQAAQMEQAAQMGQIGQAEQAAQMEQIERTEQAAQAQQADTTSRCV